MKLSEKIANFGRDESGMNAHHRRELKAVARETRMRLYRGQQAVDAILRRSTDDLAALPEDAWSAALDLLASELEPFERAAALLPK